MMTASSTGAAGQGTTRPADRPVAGRREKCAFTLIELLVVIAIISVLISMLMPSLRSAKELARLTVCSTNMRALGLSMHMYVYENDEEFPTQFAEGVYWSQVNKWPMSHLQQVLIDKDPSKPSGNFMTSDNIYVEHFRTWMDDLFPHNGVLDSYRCPAAREKNSAGHPLPSYGYAAGLSGYGDEVNRDMTEVRRPSDTFMFMDSNNVWAPLSNPSMFPEWFVTHGEEEVHVIYVDNHVGMVDAYDTYYHEWRTEVWGWYYPE